jgi:hypothetical protein
LLDGEARGLTCGAVEGALAGDMSATRLCLERLLSRCDQRPVTFSLPALACGEITPGEAATIAGVYEIFVGTAGIARANNACSNLPQILTAGDDVGDEDEDIGDAKAIGDCNR